MDTARKGLAGVFAALFIATAVLSMLLFNLERKAFLAETYQQAFANENFYERLPALLAKAFVASSDQQGMPLGMRSMSEQQWEGFLRELLPPETLKTMGDQALTSTFAYLNGETDSAVVDLTPLKSQMSSSAGTQAVLNLMQTLPPCTLDELARITLSFLSDQQIAFCNPPAELAGVVQPLIEGQVQLAATLLPDQVTLAQFDPTTGQPDPRQQIQSLRLLMRLSPLLPLMLLFAMTVLAVRSLHDWLGWWGIPFIVTGLSVNIMAWTGAPLTSWIFLKVLLRYAPTLLPSVLLDDVSQLAEAIVHQALAPLSLQGWILIGLGLLMTALAFGPDLLRKVRA